MMPRWETAAPGDSLFIAQVFANRGSAFKGLDQIVKCIESYEQALEADPSLAEARMMLARHCIESEDYSQALDHLNHTIRRKGSAVVPESMHGWRALVLFRVGDHQLAFQDIWSIVSHAEHLLGRGHGAQSLWLIMERMMLSQHSTRSGSGMNINENTRISWARCSRLYTVNTRSIILGLPVSISSNSGSAVSNSPSLSPTTSSPSRSHRSLGPSRQQLEGGRNAFRMAYELRPDIFACCLGTALNFLDRFEEAVGVMLPFADTHPEDAIVQFQLGVSLARTHQYREAAKRFVEAAMLDMSYEKAWFNLGGNLWNNSNASINLDDWAIYAFRTWAYALAQWPDHEMSCELKSKFPILATFDQTQSENNPKSILDNVTVFLEP